jgi:hypothetical protein
MTVLSERVRAIVGTKQFLYSLLNPRLTPRVSKKVREEARRLCRHYPYDAQTERAYLLEAKERKEPLY